MARFYKELSTGIWINLDAICSMTFNPVSNETEIWFGNKDITVNFNGDITNEILCANDDVTMRDKVLINYVSSKIKMNYSFIVSKFDNIISKLKDIYREMS